LRGASVAGLNTTIVRDLIDRRGLQQWWIAEQLGINRRTLYRWLTGQTANIPPASIVALAGILESSVEDITQQEVPMLATAADQLRAARSLIDNGTMEELLAGHRFREFETLAKGLLVPGLTRDDLGELYQRLAGALMRQSKLAECRQYATLAHQLARESGNDRLRLRANMLLSYSSYVAGDARACLRQDRQNLAEARRLDDPWQIAANLSNLADQYLEFGRYSRSIALQRMAIGVYTELDSSTSLAFCYLGLVQLYRETTCTELAYQTLECAKRHVERADFKRGKADVKQMDALLRSDAGQHDEAISLLREAMAIYDSLQIREGRAYRYAAYIHEQAGDVAEAMDMIEQGLKAVAVSGVVIEKANLILARCGLLEASQQVEQQIRYVKEVYKNAGYVRRLEAMSQSFAE
jgi:tetratricopeptide (TPR) repeat protein